METQRGFLMEIRECLSDGFGWVLAAADALTAAVSSDHSSRLKLD